MELTLIVAALLAAVAGLVVAAAYALRAAAGHRHGLTAAGWKAACPPGRRLRARWGPLAARIQSRSAAEWLFSASAVLGLSVIVAATAVTGTVVEDVTGNDGVAVLDRPVAAFVVAHRSGALTVAMRAVSAAVLAALVGISRVYLGVHWMTDVLGGWAIGACWAAVAITGWIAVTR